MRLVFYINRSEVHHNGIAGQQPLLQNNSPRGAYDSVQNSAIDNELSMAMRGMAVEDDYSLAQQAQSYRQQTSQPPLPQIRVPPQLQQRAPYSGYPQTDYTAYYNGPSARIDYQYSYDAYRTTSDPSLYASSPALSAATTAPSVYPGLGPHHHAVADIHNQQSGVFYDYPGSARAMGSQFFYPSQAMVYHQPPSHSPMLAGTTVSDKKRDIPVCSLC